MAEPRTHTDSFTGMLRRAVQRLRPRHPAAGAARGGDPWWKHSVIYEIYLRSFQDSDGDGVGDLGGVVQRLDYLEALGVDAIWITPLYPSPEVDFGYDISDYRAIDPQFGTLADFDRLILEAAKRGIRVLLDMVLNHTSEQHPWFVEAARSRNSPHHGFYVWSDGRTDADGRRLRAMIDTYPGRRVLVGETYLPSTADLDAWYGGVHHNELHLPMDTLVGLGSTLDATTFRQRLMEAATEIHDSQPLLVFDNHDRPRSWDRYGDGAHDAQIARIIATLLLTSRAAVLLYQGEEIGQRTSPPKRVEDVRDPMGIRGWPRVKGRDGERTPMQWDAGPQAGFSRSQHPWLPVAAGYERINVHSETADPGSLLNWHRHLIAMRRSYAALRSGVMVMLEPDSPSVLSYARVAADGAAMVVALNMSAAPQTLTVDLAAAGVACRSLATLLSSPPGIASIEAGGSVTLPPYAAWVAAVHGHDPDAADEPCSRR
ncbi:MAG TPA: alpha-amylase family glycosyl hydrolase [Steroidobacteraceae bacterium]|nr:alpha-amylase family glycosyl hydrolase [Steroidobacteraceae bacterium]